MTVSLTTEQEHTPVQLVLSRLSLTKKEIVAQKLEVDDSIFRRKLASFSSEDRVVKLSVTKIYLWSVWDSRSTLVSFHSTIELCFAWRDTPFATFLAHFQCCVSQPKQKGTLFCFWLEDTMLEIAIHELEISFLSCNLHPSVERFLCYQRSWMRRWWSVSRAMHTCRADKNTLQYRWYCRDYLSEKKNIAQKREVDELQ